MEEQRELKHLFGVMAVRQWLEIEAQLHIPLDNVIRFNNGAGLVGFMEVYDNEQAALEAAALIAGDLHAHKFVFPVGVDKEMFDINTKKYQNDTGQN